MIKFLVLLALFLSVQPNDSSSITFYPVIDVNRDEQFNWVDTIGPDYSPGKNSPPQDEIICYVIKCLPRANRTR